MLFEKLYHKLWKKVEKSKIKKGYRSADNSFDDIDCMYNLCYGSNPKNNTLDFHYVKGVQRKLPTIIIIHGGGYISGKKEGNDIYAKQLADKGFCVINMEYTKCDNEDKKYFIDQIAEVYDMFDYIKKNKKIARHIDFNNIFLAGDSAGAHIASMVASIQTNKLLKNEFNLQDGLKIKGLIFVSPVFGPYGFGGLPMGKAFKNMVFGKNYKKEPTTKKLHTLNVMSKDFPPTIMFSAYNDFVAGPHKKLFCKKAIKLNIPLMHYTIKKGYKVFHDSLINFADYYPKCMDKISDFVNDLSNNVTLSGFKNENISEDKIIRIKTKAESETEKEPVLQENMN